MLAAFAERSQGTFEMFPAVPAPVPKVSEVSRHPCSSWSHQLRLLGGSGHGWVTGEVLPRWEKRGGVCWLPGAATGFCSRMRSPGPYLIPGVPQGTAASRNAICRSVLCCLRLAIFCNLPSASIIRPQPGPASPGTGGDWKPLGPGRASACLLGSICLPAGEGCLCRQGLCSAQVLWLFAAWCLVSRWIRGAWFGSVQPEAV